MESKRWLWPMLWYIAAIPDVKVYPEKNVEIIYTSIAGRYSLAVNFMFPSSLSFVIASSD
jgi:hypothetical protein